MTRSAQSEKGACGGSGGDGGGIGGDDGGDCGGGGLGGGLGGGPGGGGGGPGLYSARGGMARSDEKRFDQHVFNPALDR